MDIRLAARNGFLFSLSFFKEKELSLSLSLLVQFYPVTFFTCLKKGIKKVWTLSQKKKRKRLRSIEEKEKERFDSFPEKNILVQLQK